MLSNLLNLLWVSVTECMSLGAGGVRKGLINQISMEGPLWEDLQGYWVGSVGVCDCLQSLSSERGKDSKMRLEGAWLLLGRLRSSKLRDRGAHIWKISLFKWAIRRGFVSAIMCSTASRWPSGYILFLWFLCDLGTVRSAACAQRRHELMLLWLSAVLPCFF